MTDTTLDDRVTRLEAKAEALETYLPALLDSMKADITALRSEMKADMTTLRSEVKSNLEAVRSEVRFTHIERIALIVAILAIPAALIFASI